MCFIGVFNWPGVARAILQKELILSNYVSPEVLSDKKKIYKQCLMVISRKPKHSQNNTPNSEKLVVDKGSEKVPPCLVLKLETY